MRGRASGARSVFDDAHRATLAPRVERGLTRSTRTAAAGARRAQDARSHTVSHEILVERLFETLVSGDRTAARAIVEETRQRGIAAETLLTDVFWPTYEMTQ